MDDAAGPTPGASRSLDVAGGGRLYPVAAGTSVGRRPSPALGTTARSRQTDASSGPSRPCGAAADGGNARQRTKTLRALAGSTPREPVGSCSSLPGPEKGRVRRRFSPNHSHYAGFADHGAALAAVKSQAKGAPTLLPARVCLQAPSSVQL